MDGQRRAAYNADPEEIHETNAKEWKSGELP
jgi:hypothetical protein